MDPEKVLTVERLKRAFDSLAGECAQSEGARNDDLATLLQEIQRLRYFEHEVARLLARSPCYTVESAVDGISLSGHTPVPGTMDEPNVYNQGARQ